MPTPDFVLRLREKIGHDPLWMTGVTAVILDDRERILLCRRADNGAWTPITGIVDPGEQPADTAVREAEEETGVRIAVEGLASVLSNPPLVFPNGDRAQYIDHTFACTYLGGEPHPADGENTDARWFAIDDLPDMSPHMLARIEAGFDDVEIRRPPLDSLVHDAASAVRRVRPAPRPQGVLAQRSTLALAGATLPLTLAARALVPRLRPTLHLVARRPE